MMFRIASNTLAIQCRLASHSPAASRSFAPVTQHIQWLSSFSRSSPYSQTSKLAAAPSTCSLYKRPTSPPLFARCYASRKDIMKGYNPTGENPAMNEAAAESDEEPDDSVQVYFTKETRSDECVVYMDGQNTTLPIDGLYTQIRSMNINQVLSMVETSHEFLDKIPNVLPLALRRIGFVSKKYPAVELEILRKRLPKDDQFKLLCALLARQGPDLDAEKSMDMLKYMYFLGLDSGHPAVRVYLQLAMEFINDIELHQVAALTDIVFSIKPSKVTTLLKEGLKLLAKNFFPKDVRTLDMDERVNLAYFLGESMDEKFRLLLLRTIEEELGLFRHTHVPKLLTTLARHDLHSDVLLDECLLKFDPQIGSQLPAEINQVVKAMTQMKLFVPDLIAKVCSEAGWEAGKWTTKDIHTLIQQLKIQGFCENEVCSRAEDVFTARSFSVAEKLETLFYLSDCRVTVLNDEDAIGKLENDLDNRTQREMSTDTMTEWGLASVALEEPVPTTVSLVLGSVTTLDGKDIGDESRINLGDKLLVLSQHMKNAELSEVASRSARAARRKESDLRGALKYIADTIGAISVQNSVYTDAGHYIDHIVTEKTVGEEQGQRIGVLVFPEKCFMRNTGQLKGVPYLLCKSIQNEGLNVLVFNEGSWERMLEGERTEYVLHKIKEAESYQDLLMVGPDNASVKFTHPSEEY